MSVLEQVKARRSVRTFNGIRLSMEKLDEILKMAEAAENPWHLPITWKILDAKVQKLSCPVITGTDTYIGGKMKRVPHAEEAFGYAFENVVLELAGQGLGTTWIGGTMDRKAFERAMDLKDDEIMPCISPLGTPAEKFSLRETLMRKGVKADIRLPQEALFFQNDFDHPVSPDDPLHDVLELVRLAPSAVNKQPWRIVLKDDMAYFYEHHDKGYIDSAGSDMQKIDLGIAMCHFVKGIQELGKTAVFTEENPGITVPADTEFIAGYRIG